MDLDDIPEIDVIDYDAETEREAISCSDVRWQFWSAFVLEAMANGTRRACDILALKPGGLGPSKLRHCIAWLENRGLAIYSVSHGWRPTAYGAEALRARAGLCIAAED